MKQSVAKVALAQPAKARAVSITSQMQRIRAPDRAFLTRLLLAGRSFQDSRADTKSALQTRGPEVERTDGARATKLST